MCLWVLDDYLATTLLSSFPLLFFFLVLILHILHKRVDALMSKSLSPAFAQWRNFEPVESLTRSGCFLFGLAYFTGHAAKLYFFHLSHAHNMTQKLVLARLEWLTIHCDGSAHTFNLLSSSLRRFTSFSLAHSMLHQDVYNSLPSCELSRLFLLLCLLSCKSFLDTGGSSVFNDLKMLIALNWLLPRSHDRFWVSRACLLVRLTPSYTRTTNFWSWGSPSRAARHCWHVL